jgi:hypothetical protein
MTVTVNFSSAIKPKPVVYYVDVADSTDTPELFANEASALAWAKQHHPDWKIESEMVRQRFEAAVGYNGAVEEAQTGGWYRPGPVPTPRDPDAPGPPHEVVYVVHSGLTTFVFQDKSDADATYYVWSLHPEHGSRHHLHTVAMRP